MITTDFQYGVRCWICMLLFSLQMGAQMRRVDLRQWGYKPPEQAREAFQMRLSSQIISIGLNGDVSLGFVTRDRTGLVTRQLPALSFHVLRFTKSGTFLSQRALPTASWYQNAILSGIDGKLLVRTGEKLGLFSANFELLGERELPSTPNSGLVDWQIFPLPHRTAFILHNFRHADTSIELVSWSDLKPISKCPYSPYARLLSVSEKSLLALYASRSDQPLLRSVEVAQICGPSQFSYSWEGDPLNAMLVDGDGLLLAGGSATVRYVVGDKVQWKDTFNKGSDQVSNHVEADENGELAAIAVKKFGGGSQLLDIPTKLKGIKIVAYQISSGRRVWDVPVDPLPSSQFDFALSPKGDILAIVSDGFLEIVQSEK